MNDLRNQPSNLIEGLKEIRTFVAELGAKRIELTAGLAISNRIAALLDAVESKENSILARQTADRIIAKVVERGSVNVVELADAITSDVQATLDRSNEFWKVQEKVNEGLRSSILKHRDETRGHGSCWLNDIELWRTVAPSEYPRGDVPPWCEFMTKCAEYRAGLEAEELVPLSVRTEETEISGNVVPPDIDRLIAAGARPEPEED